MNTDRLAAKQTKISIISSLLKLIDLNDEYGCFFPRKAITAHGPDVMFANVVVTSVFYCNKTPQTVCILYQKKGRGGWIEYNDNINVCFSNCYLCLN